MHSAPPVPPRAFLSYSHDSREHEDAVLELSDRLRSDGVDCSVDQYVPNPPEGWLTWMQSQIETADFVLLLCTEVYKTRLEKNEEPGIGLGAIWEGQLIFHDLYKGQGRNSKYVPIVRTLNDERFIPSILAAYTHYNVGTESGYNRLYARLTGQPEALKPPLGTIRTLPPKNRVMDARQISFSVALRAELVTSATFSYAHPEPHANEIEHVNYVNTLAKTLNSAKRLNAMSVEGAEGIGKTTLLAQFSRTLLNQCVSLFIEDDDRLTYDPDSVRLNVSRQAHWILHSSKLQATSVDQETYQGYVDRLRTMARRKRTPVYLLVDGLSDLAATDLGAAKRVVDLLPPPALDGLKYLLTGEADELAPLFGHSANPFKSFPLVEFDLDETIGLFEGILTDRTILRELHNACSGNPAFLTSARRLIVRGMKPHQLIASLSRASSPFDIEWSIQERNHDIVKKVLAHLAFNDKRSTITELSTIVSLPPIELHSVLTSLSVISMQADGAVRFRAKWFRSQAQRELYNLRRSVHKTIAKQLLDHAVHLSESTDIPHHYAQAEDYGSVLTHLSPDHMVELIQKAQSINRVQSAVRLGMTAAKQLDRTADLIRFALNSAVLNDFFRVGYAVPEVSALAALKEYEAAFSIARSAALREDRLHLLAIIARRKIQNREPVEPEVLQQLTVLAADIDPAPLGRRLLEICSDLGVVLPDVALDLAEKAQTEAAERDNVFARLSASAFLAAEEHSTALFAKMKSRGHEGRLDLMQDVIAAVYGKWSADEVLARVRKLEKARDRLFILRAWMRSAHHSDDTGRVLEHALTAAITATDYTLNATNLREMAEGLQYVKDETAVRKLIDMFTAQRGVAQKLGPTVDYIRLDVLLIQAEASWDASNTETRLLTIFYEITQLTDLESRVRAWAWFIHGLKSIAVTGRAGNLRILITDSIKELEESFVSLLYATADHRRVATDVVLTVARWDVNKSIEFARMLNTELRRDRVLLDLARNIMLDSFPSEAADNIKGVILAIRSHQCRDAAVSMALISLSGRTSISSGHIVACQWLVSEALNISDARTRTRTLQSGYAILCRHGDVSPDDLSNLAAALDSAWQSISTAWHRVADGFSIAQALAQDAPTLARDYVQRSQRARHEIGGLASHTAANAYLRVIELVVRLFAGLSRRSLNTPSDQSLLSLQIDRIPSPGARAILWSEAALKCAVQGRTDLCRDFVNERVRPALAFLPDGDRDYRQYVMARVAPAVFAADTAAASVLFGELDQEWRDYGCFLTIAYLFRNTVPTDPEDYTPGSGYEVTFGQLVHICDIAQHVESDALTFNIIERVIDCIVGRKNELRLKQNQTDEIARRLLALTSEKFPNPRSIKHNGFKVISLVQLNRYRSFTLASQLVTEAQAIPNTADRGYVLFEIGLMMFKSDRGQAQPIIDEALNYLRSIPVRVERIGWFISLADHARLVSSALGKQMLKEVSKAIRAGDADDNPTTIRNLVDVAASISDEFGNEVASALDDDQAKQLAQQRAHLRALKQRIIDETPVKDELEGVSAEDYSALAGMLIGTLHSGRMDSIRLSSSLKIMEAVARHRLSQTHQLVLWVVENAVERHSKDDRASLYLRPLFDGTLSCAELTAKLAEQVFTREKRRSSEVNGVLPTTSEGEELFERQSFFDFLRRWIGSLDDEEILINDPSFDVEDLAYLKVIKTASPASRVIIVTRQQSFSATKADQDAKAMYLSFWRAHISEQRPPNTRFLFLESPDGSSPFPDVLILAETTGVLLGASLREFGVAGAVSVRHLESADVQGIRETVRALILGEVVDVRGQKVECLMFRL